MDDNAMDINPATAEATLEALLPAIRTIPEDQALTCTVPGTLMVQVGREMVPLLERDRAAIEAAFAAPPIDVMLSIDKRSLAVFAAEKRVVAIDPTPVSDLPALYTEAGELKSQSLKLLDLTAGDEEEVARTIARVQPGTGYTDRANDLGAIHPMLMKYKSAILGTSLMTQAQIDRVGELVPLLLQPKTGKPAALEAARVLRNQAYTYFMRSYTEIRRHAAFIHDGAPKMLETYPNLFSLRISKKK